MLGTGALRGAMPVGWLDCNTPPVPTGAAVPGALMEPGVVPMPLGLVGNVLLGTVPMLAGCPDIVPMPD